MQPLAIFRATVRKIPPGKVPTDTLELTFVTGTHKVMIRPVGICRLGKRREQGELEELGETDLQRGPQLRVARLCKLTFDVQEDGLALHLEVVVGHAVAHPTAVVPPRGFLDTL